jgi:serine/threonine protein kinase
VALFDSHDYKVVREDRPTAVAQVYEATHPEQSGRLLVEVLSAGISTAPRLEAFERDVAAVTLLDHPCVLEVLDLGALPDGTPVVISEYPEGTTLARWLEEERAARPDEALEVITGLAEALTAAHASGVTHGALRPDQVYLVRERGRTLGAPKVRGFGQRWLSAATPEPQGNSDKSASSGLAGPALEEIAADVRALATLAELLLTPPRLRGRVDGLVFEGSVPEAAEAIRHALADGDEAFVSPRAFAGALAIAFHPDLAEDNEDGSRALVPAGVRALTRWGKTPRLAVGLAAGVSLSLLVAVVAGLVSQMAPAVEARSTPGHETTTAPVEVPALPAAAAAPALPTITGVKVTSPSLAAIPPARPRAVASIGEPRRPGAPPALRRVVWSDVEHALVNVDEHGIPLPPRDRNPQP